MAINIENFLKLIDNITIAELNELIKILEKKFNYNINNNNNNINNIAVEKEQNKNYSLILLDFGSNKISVIKLIKDLLNLSLKDSKDLVDSCPVLIKDNLNSENAQDLKSKFESSGAKVEIK